MIKVFQSTDTSFTSNGDIVLKPYRAKVRKEDNGAYYLDIEVGVEYTDWLVSGNILVANTPQGDQAFRISDYEKTNNKIKIKANHVFFDSVNYLIADAYVVDRNANDALDHLNMATDPVSEFTTWSDVGTENSYRCVRKSLYEAIQTVIERWGGHLIRDNFSIRLYTDWGADNGVVVRYKKNLQNISVNEDWSKVVTKLMPVGRDGLLLPEVYVLSQVQYELPYTKAVSFNQQIDQQDYETEEAYHDALIADLRHQAQIYVENNCVPKVNYTLKAHLDTITDVGDVVHVIDERLRVNLITNVIAYTYDCILDRYTEIEFGNFQQKLSGLISTVTSTAESIATEKVDSAMVILGEELQQAQDTIMGILGNSYVIYDGDQILVVDALPKEEAHNVLRINSGGIGFSQNGINGTFNSAWTIDGTMDMQQINVIGLTADLIKGGTLKLGSQSNQSGLLEIYDEGNTLIGQMDKNGLKMFGVDGSYVLLNNTVGFAGYDRNDNPIYWVSQDEFHMRKSVIEEEITLCNKMRFIPITLYSGSTIVNDGIGLVSVGG